MRDYTMTGEFQSPTRYHFVEVLEGMCELRKLVFQIKSKPVEQSFFSKLIDGKKENISFKITGSKYKLDELKYTLETIFKYEQINR